MGNGIAPVFSPVGTVLEGFRNPHSPASVSVIVWKKDCEAWLAIMPCLCTAPHTEDQVLEYLSFFRHSLDLHLSFTLAAGPWDGS